MSRVQEIIMMSWPEISGYLNSDSRKVCKGKFKFLINYSPRLIQKNLIEPGCMENWYLTEFGGNDYPCHKCAWFSLLSSRCVWAGSRLFLRWPRILLLAPFWPSLLSVQQYMSVDARLMCRDWPGIAGTPGQPQKRFQIKVLFLSWHGVILMKSWLKKN